MDLINKQYKQNIENSPVIQQIINALFHDTKWFFFLQMNLFAAYLIPFFLQILVFDHYCIAGENYIQGGEHSLNASKLANKVTASA